VSVCVSVNVSIHAVKKMTYAIDTGHQTWYTYTLWQDLIDPEIKRSKVKCHSVSMYVDLAV